MKRLLVCTDGSAYSQVCCRYAAWLAGVTGAEVEVLYVTDLRQFEVPMVADLSGGLGIQPYQVVLSQLQELEEEKAKLVLDHAGRILRENAPDVSLTLTHKTGFLVDCFQPYEEACDLILLGKRGENANFATGHLGSTMERMVRASEKPCLVTSRGFRDVRTILLAYDGGASTRKALAWLTGMDAFKSFRHHVVVVSGPKDEETALERLAVAETALKEAGRETVCQMLHGVPEAEIAGYVEEEGIDLLVMGAYGHGRIRELLIGSTTSATIRLCKIPVLLIR